MAKQLKKIFDPGLDQISQNFTIESWHVSQSVDALTGADDYNIIVSGSFTVTGSVGISGLTDTSQTDVVTIDTTTGQLYYTASSAIGGGGGSTDTGSLLTTSSLTENTMSFAKGDGTSYNLDLSGVFVEDALRTAITVKNMSAGTIAKGTPCYITGSGASGNIAGVVPADAGDANIMPAGVVTQGELTNPGDEGIGIIAGFINGVDTSTFSEGDNVYVAVGGGYTNVKPTGSALIQKLGNIEKVDASNGSGVITGAGRSNDLPNITSGYFWVGNSDSVPVAVPTSSISGGSINTGSFYVSSSINSTGNTITFEQGDSTTESVTVNVNPGGIYDIENRSTGDNQFTTTLETIAGSTTVPSGSTIQSVRIGEIQNLTLGNQVHITATIYGAEGTYGNKQVYVYQTGGGNSFPGTINANGDITFRLDVAPTVDTPVMYHVIYTTDEPI